MLLLPDVTLLMYDAKAPEMGQAALASVLEEVEFGAIQVWTAHPVNFDLQGDDSQVIKIDGDISKENGQGTLWNEIVKHIKTPHILNMEWDSGLNDPSMWTDEFLEYDFVGAPWPWHTGHRVGNGGFSLLSRRLMETIADPEAGFPYAFPWDDTLCRRYRLRLEDLGFRWAPERLAEQFSLEHGPSRRSFGFHDCRNFLRVLAMRDLLGRMTKANDFVKAHPAWQAMEAHMERLPMCGR